MGTDGQVSFSHVGICVRDLDRSLRFYTEGLGFEHQATHDLDGTYADALEVPGVKAFKSVFLSKGTTSIELLAYDEPPAEGTPSSRRNLLGLTHLSFWVADPDATAASLVAAGGTLIESTRTKGDGTYLLFCADPDGTRVELMQQQAG
jgi:catechol 2,3-dioxygenase-like lactoylglutathione lyase family enzyme